MAEEKKKIHIRLHVYDTDIPVNVLPDDEPYCRNAAKLITDKVNKLSELYKHSRSEKDILYMAMLDIAINLEIEKAKNDTQPYNDILKKLTAEIEKSLG
ncbi:MAG: cell division protein ZapA [Prevotella sp.]